MAANDPLYMLSEADRAILRRAVEIADRLRGNPALRPHFEEPDLQSPDVYIALTPAAGIPAMSGAGTGSEDPGSAECEVYRISTGPGTAPTPLIVDASFTRTVWNLSAAAIDGNSWVTTVRDKWGSWLAVPVGSGAAGAQHNPVTRVYTTSGTWTKPANLDYVEVQCIASGGGGGGAIATAASHVSAGGGGGAGGYASVTVPAGSLGATESYTVGGGGAGGSGVPTSGTDGADSSFGIFVSASGGTGGLLSLSQLQASPAATALGGAGGVGTVGDVLGAGECGFDGINLVNSTAGGRGGSITPFGAGGLGGNDNSGLSLTGLPGQGAGSGGGGAGVPPSTAGHSGGDGADGLIIVREYYTS